jgi:hypothetical protein
MRAAIGSSHQIEERVAEQAGENCACKAGENCACKVGAEQVLRPSPRVAAEPSLSASRRLAMPTIGIPISLEAVRPMPEPARFWLLGGQSLWIASAVT